MKDTGRVAAERFPQARTWCPKCGLVSINTTCPKCVVPTEAVPEHPVRSGLLALANAEAAPERPNQMSFAEQFIEALNEHIDARSSYNEGRRGTNGNWDNPNEMNKTEARLQGLVEKLRFAL